MNADVQRTVSSLMIRFQSFSLFSPFFCFLPPSGPFLTPSSSFLYPFLSSSSHFFTFSSFLPLLFSYFSPPSSPVDRNVNGRVCPVMLMVAGRWVTSQSLTAHSHWSSATVHVCVHVCVCVDRRCWKLSVVSCSRHSMLEVVSASLQGAPTFLVFWSWSPSRMFQFSHQVH